MATKKKAAASAVQEVLDANRAALVGFNANLVHEALNDMAAVTDQSEELAERKRTAAHRLVVHAHTVATESRKVGATDIDKGWSENIKALYPMLAKEHNRFVKTDVRKDGTTRYTLTGYGRNVMSTCRGFCQYDDVEPDAEGRYFEDQKIIVNRRAEDLDAKTLALRAAKEVLDERIKAFRELATKGGDVELIEGATDELNAVIKTLEAMHADPEDETEADAEAIGAKRDAA